LIASGPMVVESSPGEERAVPGDWRGFLSPKTRVRVGILALLLAVTYWSTLRHTLVGRWLADGNWSHGLLIPVFSVYFLATRRDDLFRATPKPSYVGAVILGVSLLTYFFFSWRVPMAYPRAVTLIGAIFGVTLLIGGWGVMRIAWFPILFLFLAVPLPDRQYVQMTMPLRQLASSVAAAVMPVFAEGLHTEAQAVVIDYVMPGRPPGTLNVEEACSGMRSTMAFVTLGVAMAYLGDRPGWQRLIMVALCVPIAVLCNTIRVTITGLLHVYGHADLARGTPHQLLGLLMFAVALSLFALVGYTLSHLFVEEPEHGPHASSAS